MLAGLGQAVVLRNMRCDVHLAQRRNVIAGVVGFVLADRDSSSRSFGEDKADRKSTRLNSSHVAISYAVFCLKKKIDISLACRPSLSATTYNSPSRANSFTYT